LLQNLANVNHWLLFNYFQLLTPLIEINYNIYIYIYIYIYWIKKKRLVLIDFLIHLHGLSKFIEIDFIRSMTVQGRHALNIDRIIFKHFHHSCHRPSPPQLTSPSQPLLSPPPSSFIAKWSIHRHHLQLYSCSSPIFTTSRTTDISMITKAPLLSFLIYLTMCFIPPSTQPTTKHFLFIHKRII
jgi:hypothetical protein